MSAYFYGTSTIFNDECDVLMNVVYFNLDFHPEYSHVERLPVFRQQEFVPQGASLVQSHCG